MQHLNHLEKGVLFMIAKKLNKLRAIKGIHQYTSTREFFAVPKIPKGEKVKCVSVQNVFSNHPRSVVYKVLNELDVLLSAFLFETEQEVNERRSKALPLIGLFHVHTNKKNFLIQFEGYYIDFNFHEDFSKY